MNIFMSVLLLALSLPGLVAVPPVPKIKADDLQLVTGAQWTGALTYLDYGRNKKVSISSNLVVTRSAADQLSWFFEYKYPDEPKADGKKNLVIGKNGRTINGATVMERTTLADKTLKVVTEDAGTDNDEPALLRLTYLMGAKSFSIKKEVRYVGAGEFIVRNEYSWKR
ncbi:MAG: hypothetical protein QOG71_3071 [Pyrinomonadaceae bacterium]|nr:hypothetical protein [Pyrinomonadaceae bacterium]